VLFSGSILENILYGNPQASIEQVNQAAEAANALEFIASLPDGFDTEVGERGVMLSGGQKQRITIARAFLKNPSILIFDEATSAMDSKSEQSIQQAMNQLIQDRTVFIIAHRLSTVINADLILVLHQGKIAEQGSHSHLLSMNGLYADFYNRQSKQPSNNIILD
jgi:ABC-type multidrug transport system fused ATPase/permease subunit